MVLQPKDVTAIVPPEQRWLNPLFAALMQAGVRPRRLSLGDGVLRLWLDGPAGEHDGLEMQFMVKGPAPKAWRVGEHFCASYGGAEVSPLMAQALALTWRVFQRFEPHIPADLSGFAFVGATDGPADQILPLMFPFLTVEKASHAGQTVHEVLIRTTSRCNQSCPFCSGPTHATPSHLTLIRCLDEISVRLPGAMVSLTGGEPTYRPEFVQEVAHALGLQSLSHVQIQSNAVAFAQKVDPSGFAPGGKLSFFLSLHALEAALYDENTGTTGQLPQALEGIRRVVAAGHRVVLNTVVNRSNIDHLTEMAQRLPGLFPGNVPPEWHFSALICTERSPATMEYLVPYSQLLDSAGRAGKLASDLGMSVHSMLQSTYAAVPPCLVPASERQRGRTVLERPGEETGYEDFSKRFVKAKRCRTCLADSGCLGVPRPYAERFGLDELNPLEDER